MSFFFARLWQICFLIFFTSLLPNLVLSKPHACVVCIALPSNLAVVQSQIFLGKQICFGLERVTRDKLVFGMKKHDHVSFQILTRDFYSLDFGQNL